MKKLTGIVLILALLFALAVPALAEPAEVKTLRIIGTSDLHGKFMPWDYALNSESMYGSTVRFAYGTEEDMHIEAENPFMTEAIEEALDGISHGHGGPFGCVIVRDGEIIGRGHNMVLADRDSTAHGEITAIRDAEKELDSYDLSGCELYTTGEPCPMCLFAILWANIDQVYYGCTIEDNADIGFRDEIFDELAGGRTELEDFLTCIDRDACLELFETYRNMEHSVY